MADPNRSIAIFRAFRDDCFLADSPANAARGLETTRNLTVAARGFADQSAVDSFVTARGGNTADWLFLDLSVVGVR